LLRNRANASRRDKQGYSPVHYAAAKGHRLALEMVRVQVSLIDIIILPSEIEKQIMFVLSNRYK